VATSECAPPEFYITVVPGLEDMAAQEVVERGGRVVSSRPGKLFLSFDDPRPLLALRSAMNLYAFVGERADVPPDASAGPLLSRAAAELDLGPALAQHAALTPPPQQPSFRITAVRSGRHGYTSQDIAAWTGAGVQQQTGWRVDLEGHDYEIEVEVVGPRALFGLRLGPGYRERRQKAAYHPASLNPTVAYAMLRLNGYSTDERFLDVACGGGTLLTERAALGPARLLVGGDIWWRALEIARRNLAAEGVTASVLRWDAGRLPLRDASVDRAASNLPFGHRVGHAQQVRGFYRRLLPELARVLRPGGRAALLTSRRRWLDLALRDCAELRREGRRRIVLGGKESFIFLLARRSAGAPAQQRGFGAR